MRTKAEPRATPATADAAVAAELAVRDLPRIGAPSVATFRDSHVRPRRPVLVQGLVADWPAVRRWSLDYLTTAFGRTPITTARLEDGQVALDDTTGLIYEDMRLSEFIAALRAGARDRYLMSRLDTLPDDLRRDVPAPPYIAGALWQDAKLWISPTGTVSYTHRDLADNLHAQVCGRKRFTLIAPEHTAGLYPKTLLDSTPNGCHADIERPDFHRFPRLREVDTFVAELGPGDAIYIPRRWWHHVRTLEASVSVNFWWANGARSLLVLAGDYFKRLRGLNR